MSQALAYLVKARPEAMQSYFRFLKDAGSRLDPKTRNLISVITKVHAQTENGLRQYLTRALREGATAEEIIDALLMAFPALGLARIVWAADVILKMDLPEFRLDAPPAEPAWHDVAAFAALADGKATRLDCDGRGLFVGRRTGPGWRIRRVDLDTGEETPWTEVTPKETAGLRLSGVYLTPNGQFWAHSSSRLLTDLYVAENIK